jgi:predicted transglutaminase-like cysteine proteinase
MFGRVVACGIAASSLLAPVSSRGEAPAFATMAAPAVSATTAATGVQFQEPAQDRASGDAPMPAKLAALDPAQSASRAPALAQPFGLDTVAVASGDVATKWTGVEAEIRAESKILARCRDGAEPCSPAARDFLAIVAQGRARTGRARIGVINRAINLAIRPTSDLAQWGVPDRWSAPLDTLSTGRGDCEDYAIAKYVALKEAGVADADVKLVIVHDLAADEDHAVTAARLDGRWIVLDNRWLTLVDDGEMRRIIPLFVLNDDGVRQFAPDTMPGTRHATAPGDGAASAPGALGF